MDLTNQIILFVGALFFVSILGSLISSRVGVPVLLIFLGLGMLLGEDGPGGIEFDNVQVAHFFASLALAIILFDGGLRTKTETFRVALRPAALLATVGVVITTVVTGAFAVLILDLDWLQGLLLGAIVGSTDAAAVFSLLHTHGLEIKQRVGATLEIESGANDPMAIFFTIALVEVLQSSDHSLGLTLLTEFVIQMGLGAAVGLTGGWLLARLINRVALSGGLYPLLAMSGGLTIFGLTAVAGGSGFLAIYLAALVLGNQRLQAAQNIRRFHDALAWLSQIGMFLLLGLLVAPSQLLLVAGPALALSAVLIVLARPLAVWLCLLPFSFPWREQLFISWVGLRGAVPIILALIPLLAGLESSAVIFNVVFFVVLVSLLVQGWSVAPVARGLDLEVPATSQMIQRVELEVPGQLDYEIIGYQLTATSPVVVRSSARLALPDTTRFAAVIREGDLLRGDDMAPLQAGDYIYLVAPPHDLHLLDQAFAAAPAPEPLEERRFFGEFVLDSDARLGDLATVYGLEAPKEADLTVAEYISKAFSGRAVIGDRVDLANVQLVVREMERGEITKVGLKLASNKRNRKTGGADP